MKWRQVRNTAWVTGLVLFIGYHTVTDDITCAVIGGVVLLVQLHVWGEL